MANEMINNPFWQGIPYAPETLPPEILQQLEQRRSLMGGGGAPPQQFQQIQVPDIQYSPQMKKQALGQGLMQAGLSMLANMKPTALPQSPFANLGQAGLEGMQAYQGNLNNALKTAMQFQKTGPSDLDRSKQGYYDAMAKRANVSAEKQQHDTLKIGQTAELIKRKIASGVMPSKADKQILALDLVYKSMGSPIGQLGFVEAMEIIDKTLSNEKPKPKQDVIKYDAQGNRIK